MSDYVNNYLLQDAIEAYLSTNLATFKAGVAAVLPIVKGGDFGNRGVSHIYVVAPELEESSGVDFGSEAGAIIVGVGTLKEVTLTEHRAYCEAVFGLMMELNIATYINAAAINDLRINQRVPGVKTRIGALTEGMRFSEKEVRFMVYQTT